MGRQAYLDKIAFVHTPPASAMLEDMSDTLARDGLPLSPPNPPRSRPNTSSSNRRSPRFHGVTTRPRPTTTSSSTTSAATPSTPAPTSMARNSEAPKTMCSRLSASSSADTLPPTPFQGPAQSVSSCSKPRIRLETPLRWRLPLPRTFAHGG
ncbi:hypothetical protein IG631_18086 [Alternaria alternata]|nr:hypothetical protein IG631_18086 [Alternaria alternata]